MVTTCHVPSPSPLATAECGRSPERSSALVAAGLQTGCAWLHLKLEAAGSVLASESRRADGLSDTRAPRGLRRAAPRNSARRPPAAARFRGVVTAPECGRFRRSADRR